MVRFTGVSGSLAIQNRRSRADRRRSSVANLSVNFNQRQRRRSTSSTYSVPQVNLRSNRELLTPVVDENNKKRKSSKDYSHYGKRGHAHTLPKTHPPNGISRRQPYEVSTDLPDLPNGLPLGHQYGLSSDVPSGMSSGLPLGTSHALSVGPPHGMPNGRISRMSNGMPHGVSNGLLPAGHHGLHMDMSNGIPPFPGLPMGMPNGLALPGTDSGGADAWLQIQQRLAPQIAAVKSITIDTSEGNEINEEDDNNQDTSNDDDEDEVG